MRGRRPGRSWPYPRRSVTAASVDAADWAALIRDAALEPESADATVMLAELAGMLPSLALTLDGRLVSEARPTPTEIRDPLAVDGIPGALALTKYFANIDAASVEALLDGYLSRGPLDGHLTPLDTTSSKPEGGQAALSDAELQGAARRLKSFVAGLREFLPAMVRVAQAAHAEVVGGRPAATQTERRHIVVELATIWAQFADAGWSDFPSFVARFFVLVGLEPPPAQLVASALADAGDLDQLDAEQLADLRRQRRALRAALLHACEGPRFVRYQVTSLAMSTWNAAKAAGWPVEGDAWSWLDAPATRAARRKRLGRSRAAKRAKGPGRREPPES